MKQETPIFDQMPAVVQIALLALMVITSPVWGIFAIIFAVFIDKDEEMNFDNGNDHKIDRYFENLRSDMEQQQ